MIRGHISVKHFFYIISTCLFTFFLVACQSSSTAKYENGDSALTNEANIDKVLVVDCVLPGQIRNLGGIKYLTPRRPIKTTAGDCEIRGGEYVAYDRADYRTAMNVWLPLATEGDPDAQNHVGEIFEKGLGTVADYQSAFLWYRKAAEQNYKPAQINLGYMYEKGLGVDKDVVKALNLYRQASGLDTDQLEFASSIEALNNDAQLAKQQLALAQAELSTRTREVEALRNKLKKTEILLSQHKKSISSASQEIKDLHHQLKQKKSLGASSNDPQVISIQKKLDARQVNLDQYQLELTQLESSLKKQQKELHGEAELVNRKQRTLDDALAASGNSVSNFSSKEAPSIEIIDPAMVLTRSEPVVRLRSVAKHRIIFGKINAPAGLKSFTVNKKTQRTDRNGMFRVSIPLENQATPVKMLVTDKLGQETTFNFSLIPPLRKTAKNESNIDFTNIPGGGSAVDFGDYYAVIIGNNNYKNFTNLETAVSDARQIDKILREKYGFKTTLLINADRYTILSNLNQLRETLTKKDNLLIYYAGHGELDRINRHGYWLPVDSEPDSTANWISNTAISDILNIMPAKHVLVVADSCYSGSMSRSAQARLDSGMSLKARLKWVKLMSTTRARIALTSGGEKPVLDSGGGDHSVFAKAFFDTLEDNKSIIEGYQIYLNIVDNVQETAAKYNIEQIPEYAPIKHGGGLGEFFFVPLSARS